MTQPNETNASGSPGITILPTLPAYQYTYTCARCLCHAPTHVRDLTLCAWCGHPSNNDT